MYSCYYKSYAMLIPNINVSAHAVEHWSTTVYRHISLEPTYTAYKILFLVEPALKYPLHRLIMMDRHFYTLSTYHAYQPESVMF